MIRSFRKEAPIILDQFCLTDVPFSKIAPHLPTDTRGKARVDDRRVMSGIVHVLKSGGCWIDAPPEYGPKKTLCNRYVRWAAKGVADVGSSILLTNLSSECRSTKTRPYNAAWREVSALWPYVVFRLSSKSL